MDPYPKFLEPVLLPYLAKELCKYNQSYGPQNMEIILGYPHGLNLVTSTLKSKEVSLVKVREMQQTDKSKKCEAKKNPKALIKINVASYQGM